MSEYLKKVASQISGFLSGMSAGKRIAMTGTFLFVVGAMVLMFVWAGSKNYQPLMSNLNPEDSANIIRILRDKKIPFQVDEGGKNIQIPPESVFDLRLELATMGFPESSLVGYEVFDKQALGTTSFVQTINQKRALEGELMRTIGAMRGVKRSRVHLVIPKKSPFVEEQKKATASVVLDLEPGIRPSEKQIYGIGKLVASAVEGLEVHDVVIVDSGGKTLSKNTRDPLVSLTADQLDFQRKLEDDLERRVVSVLEPVVGEGKIVAKVSTELDFSEVRETQTVYDPDGTAVRSLVKDATNSNGNRPGPAGPPGATSNQPGSPELAQANPGITSSINKDKQVTNYEVPRTVRQTNKPVGALKKISVAVILDSKTVKTTDDKGVVQSKVEVWSPERLGEIEKIVASTVGFDKKRGDVLEIKNMEFSKADFEDAEASLREQERRAYIINLLRMAVFGLLIIAFVAWVVRPFIKWLTENTIDSVDTFLPQTISELEKMQSNQNLTQLDEVMPALPEKIDPEKIEGEMIKEKIITLVDSNPHKAALIIRDWIRAKKEESPADGGKGKSA